MAHKKHLPRLLIPSGISSFISGLKKGVTPVGGHTKLAFFRRSMAMTYKSWIIQGSSGVVEVVETIASNITSVG
jgi:hypothetical protein